VYQLKPISSENISNLLFRYSDNDFEYRHVQLPKNMLKAIPKEYHDPSKGTLKLLWEEEWRALGITQVWKAHHRESAVNANSWF
jgi:hypothetical protein